MDSAMVCPVVKIKAKNSNGYTEINESDFDKDKHELYGSKPVPVKKPPSKKHKK